MREHALRRHSTEHARKRPIVPFRFLLYCVANLLLTFSPAANLLCREGKLMAAARTDVRLYRMISAVLPLIAAQVKSPGKRRGGQG